MAVPAAGRLRVVAHNGAAALGGGEIGTALLLRGLQSRGHEVEMLCRDAAMAEAIGGYGIPTAVARIGGDLAAHDAVRFAAALRRRRPDALILTTFKKVLLAGAGARMAGVPRIVQRIVLEGDDPSRGARYRFALRHLVDVVALNADAMRGRFLAGDRRLDPARVITLHDGVRAPERTRAPGAVRRELGLPADAVVVGSVGRLAEQKRFDRLLLAVARLPAVHCVIAGRGEQRAALEGLAAELGIGDRVHLTGFRDDVGDVLDALDLFVVSSDREGLSNAMLEAMAFGLPVVSTDVSGAREALDPGDAASRTDGARRAPGPAPGTVVGFDVEDLVAGMAPLVRDAALRGAAAAAARRRALDRFGWDRFVAEWESLLGPPARAGADRA